MNFRDFFNPDDRDHLVAYRELQLTGRWPQWFCDTMQTAGVARDTLLTAAIHAADLMANRYMDATLAKVPLPPMGPEATPEWIVNNAAELGVKVGNRFFFLYKGHSIEYTEDDGPMRWRPVEKREFGECCHPGYNPEPDDCAQWADRYDWQDLPKTKKE